MKKTLSIKILQRFMSEEELGEVLKKYDDNKKSWSGTTYVPTEEDLEAYAQLTADTDIREVINKLGIAKESFWRKMGRIALMEAGKLESRQNVSE